MALVGRFFPLCGEMKVMERDAWTYLAHAWAKQAWPDIYFRLVHCSVWLFVDQLSNHADFDALRFQDKIM